MSEPNTAGAQGTTNEPTQGTNAANAGTAGNAAEKTFTQAEVDRIVQNRLAADRASQPNDDELRAYRRWKATQKTDAERQAERDAEFSRVSNELAELKAENQVRAAQVKPDFAKFVAYEVGAMQGNDFEKKLADYKKENPQYFGETFVRKTASSPDLGGGNSAAQITTNQIMNDLIRGKG